MENKNLIIMVTPLNIIKVSEISYVYEDYKEGRSLKTDDVLRNSTSKPSYIKYSCYIENILRKDKV